MRVYRDKFCVYTHPHNGEVFYVGMGRTSRAFQTIKRNKEWDNYVNNINGEYDIDIIQYLDSEKEAREIESHKIIELDPKCNINKFLNKKAEIERKKLECQCSLCQSQERIKIREDIKITRKILRRNQRIKKIA